MGTAVGKPKGGPAALPAPERRLDRSALSVRNLGDRIRRKRRRGGDFSCPTLLVLGIDGAGKTSLLYAASDPRWAAAGALPRPAVTHDCLPSEVELAGAAAFRAVDMPGGRRYRGSWLLQAQAAVDGIAFVVDAAAPQRFPVVRDELRRIGRDPALRHLPVLVLAHKQDVAGAVSAAELGRRLEAAAVLRTPGQRSWDVVASTLREPEALRQSLAWLYEMAKPGPGLRRGLSMRQAALASL